MLGDSGASTTRRIAFIFGAGASMPLLPGQAALVEQLRAASAARLVPAQRYLQRFFDGLPAEAVTFEQVIGPLEIAEANEHWFHLAGRRHGQLLTNREVLRSFDHWLVRALDPDSLPRFPRASASDFESVKQAYMAFYGDPAKSELSYARLVASLSESALLEQSTFVSLNYDILLDRVLRAAGHRIDYAVDAFADQDRPYSAIRLVKLHGSVNWSICGECHVLRSMGSHAVWPGNNCGDCGRRGTRGPLLIRPTVMKDFKHRLWQEMWRTAGHDLRDADEWYVVGYSLPFADVWILRLLMQSSISKGAKVANRRVTIVNPDGASLDRFNGVFPDAVRVQATFAQWLAEGGVGGAIVGKNKGRSPRRERPVTSLKS